MSFINIIRTTIDWASCCHAIKFVRITTCITLICLFTGQFVLANDTKKITFSCWVAEDLPAFSALENLYRESFAAIGYEFTMVHFPPTRSLVVANQGITDGECARVAGYRIANPTSSLDLVEVMIAKTDLSAWGYDNTIRINGPRDLLKKNYRIAYGKSTIAMELFLSRFPLPDVQEIGSIETGVKMLARKRFDILIVPHAILEQELAQNKTEIALYSLGTLMTLEGYPYLHQRHRHIMNAFTSELMKRTPTGGILLPH